MFTNSYISFPTFFFLKKFNNNMQIPFSPRFYVHVCLGKQHISIFLTLFSVEYLHIYLLKKQIANGNTLKQQNFL